MQVDHYFTIGSVHQAQGTPCQDYALSGVLNDSVCYGVVADGCSGANAHTDIGARAISWAFIKTLRERIAGPDTVFAFDMFFHEALRNNFKAMQYDPYLPNDLQNYLATLVAFIATPSHTQVLVHGDGAIAVKYANGDIELREFRWWDNMPFYLAYQQDTDLTDSFYQVYSSEFIEPLSIKCTRFKQGEPALEVLSTSTTRFSLNDVFKGVVEVFHPEDEEIVALALFTDGIEQLGSDPLKVAQEFLAFKNFEGEFVKRRVMRALKTFHKEGLVPRDDVGVSVVWFGKEQAHG